MKCRMLVVCGLMLAMVSTAQGQSTLLGLAHTGVDGPSTLYRLDPLTGAPTLVGPISGFERCSGMDFDHAFGKLYAVCQRSSDHTTWVLITIDPSTGVGTEVGLTDPVPMTRDDDKGGVTDISFCGPANTLIAYDGSPNNQSLNCIDTNTGAGTFIGFAINEDNTNSTGGGNGIACSPDGPLFHFDTVGPIRWNAFKENLDGSLRLLALVNLPPGLPSNCLSRLNAADVEPGTREVYGSISCGLKGVGPNYLISINIDTGVSSLKGQAADGLDAIAFVPEIVLGETTLSCIGFDPPLNNGPVKVKKNGVLPLKAELLDETGDPLTDLSIVNLPVLQVMFSAGTGPAVDITDDALSAGKGTEGNQFVFSDDRWQFNLKTKNYTASGTYMISLVSGDVSEYTVSLSCTATFVIN